MWVTIGKAVGLPNLVIDCLDIKARHLEAASKALDLLFQLRDSGVSVERPVKTEEELKVTLLQCTMPDRCGHCENVSAF